MEGKDIQIATLGLSGAMVGDSQEGVSNEIELPPVRCSRCNCSLSQSSIRKGFEHCCPCRAVLRDIQMGLKTDF